jgi:hypothetical protein
MVAFLFAAQVYTGTNGDSAKGVDEPDQKIKGDKDYNVVEFRWFQAQYLVVYLVIMLADWLQGTNMYTLYHVSGLYMQIYNIYLTSENK